MLPSTPAPLKAVHWTERAVGEPDALSTRQEKGTALAAHAIFSGVGGAAYAFARRQQPLAVLPTPVAGVLFGLAVWVGTFEAALPALGVMPRTTQHPPRRWPAPLVGHALFGAVTAFVTESATRRLDR